MSFENDLNHVLEQLDSEGEFMGYHLVYQDGIPKVLGQGGSSVVYEMKSDMNLDQRYALKVIYQDIAPSQDLMEEIQLQNRVAAACENVVRVITAKEYLNEQLHFQFILMEYLEPIIRINKFHKVSLQRDELKTEVGVLRLGQDIAKALMTAHNLGILHRDVKLENIFWDEKNNCYKLGDFGVATAKITDRTMTRLGSDGYVAPEVISVIDKTSYNHLADMYSFGICLYVLLNQMRFPGAIGYQPSGMQYESDFVFPAPVNASERFTRIIRSLCAYNVKNRYESMGIVLAELHQTDSYIEESVESEDLTISDERTLRTDEATVHTEEVEIQSNAQNEYRASFKEQSQNAKRLHEIEEKTRNKELYRKIEWKYVLAMALLSVIVFSQLLYDAQDTYAGYNYGVLEVCILICLLSLTPRVAASAVPGVILAMPLAMKRWFLPEPLPLIATIVLIILIQQLLSVRVQYKQGPPIRLWYYRLFRYALPISLFFIDGLIVSDMTFRMGRSCTSILKDLNDIAIITLVFCFFKDVIKWIHIGKKMK